METLSNYQHKPVLIGGLHRSGTSLTRAIIGSHPTLAIYKSDLPLWTKLYDRYKDKNLNKVKLRKQLVDEIVTHRKAPRSIKIKFNAGEILEALNQEEYVTCGIVFHHVLRLYAQRLGRPRWGLKTPYNEFWTDAIFASYPHAKMIHVLRDPRDVAASIKSRDWNITLERTCNEWQKSAQLAQLNQQKYSGSYLAIRYEDLVDNPETIVRQICEVIELEYTPELLKMEGQLGWRGSNSYFEDIGYKKQGISDLALGRYSEHLQDFEIQFIEEKLEKEMTDWQYT